jgi:hypothetical protein
MARKSKQQVESKLDPKVVRSLYRNWKPSELLDLITVLVKIARSKSRKA